MTPCVCVRCREELQSIHRELEVLSEQYSQKCLENAHLAQALQAERQALQQCQRENQELHTHTQVHTHTDTHTHTDIYTHTHNKVHTHTHNKVHTHTLIHNS